MYFKNIEINGFRGINNLRIDELKDINLLVGKNNCGKTSVLEAIFLLVGMSNPQLINNINIFRSLTISKTDDFRLIFYNLDYNSELKIKAESFNKNHFRDLIIRPTFIDILNGEKTNGNINGTSGVISDTSIEQKEIKELLSFFTVKDSSKPAKSFQSKIKYQENNFIPIRAKEYIEKIPGLYLYQSQALTENLEKELDDLIFNKNKREIIDVLSKIDDKIKDIQFGYNRIINLDIGLGRLIPLNLLGDGIRRILSIILAIRYAKNGILLIDELENGFHYSTLKEVWKVIIEATKVFQVQVFLTTHNYETLKYLKEVLDEGADSDKERISSITLRKFDNGLINAYSYDYERFEYAIEQGLEIR